MANGTELLATNQYNWFEDDQVLTSRNLNQVVTYLDQQNRWTRNKLIGIGIVCGLDLVQTTGSITVTAGCGVTSQGFLIIEDEDQEYKYYLPYPGVSMPESIQFTYPGYLPFYAPYNSTRSILQMLTDEDFNNLDADTKKQVVPLTKLTSTKDIANYVVVLFLEESALDLKNCDMFDCNNNGMQVTLAVRALLVKKTELPVLQKKIQLPDIFASSKIITASTSSKLAAATASGITKIGGTLGTTSSGFVSAGIRPLDPSIKAPQINLKRFNVPYTDLKTTDDVINAFLKLVDDATLDAVAGAYNYCYSQYKDLLGDDAAGFPTLAQDLKKKRDSIIAGYPTFIQYFYDFIDDLIKAYYEFRMKVSELLSACCPDENLFPLHLVLGAATATTKDFAKDAYRNYFIYSPLFARQENEVSESVFLYRRMQIMTSEFVTVSPGSLRVFSIKILPSLYEQAYLSQRVIPYYYTINDPGNELYRYWSYYKTIRGNETYNLSYNANKYNTDEAVLDPLLYDIEKNNFFRIEGHIGLNYQTALTNVLQQRQKYNLPFDVVAISADQLPTGDGTLPECSIQDLDTNYKLLLTEFTCKVHTPFCYISSLQYPPESTSILLTNLTSKFNSLARTTTLVQKSAAVDTSKTTDTTKTTDTSSTLAASTFVPQTFSEFKLQLNTAVLEADLSLLDTTGYQKGDFMRQYCPPAAGTIGSTYLASIKNGVFKNPVVITRTQPDLIYYYNLFEYIDAVESLMLVIVPETLSTIDMQAFTDAYERYAGNLLRVTESITEILDDLLTDSDNQTAQLLKSLQMDQVTSELAEGVYTCLDERLQTLIDEYTNRLQTYQLQQSFYYYYQKHSGLEHKAGVPKGGTFVMVYHPAAISTNTGLSVNANAFTAGTANLVSSFAKANTNLATASSAQTEAKLFLARKAKIVPDTTKKTTKTTAADILKSKLTATSEKLEAKATTPDVKVTPETKTVTPEVAKTTATRVTGTTEKPVEKAATPVTEKAVNVDVSKTVDTAVETPVVKAADTPVIKSTNTVAEKAAIPVVEKTATVDTTKTVNVPVDKTAELTEKPVTGATIDTSKTVVDTSKDKLVVNVPKDDTTTKTSTTTTGRTTGTVSTGKTATTGTTSGTATTGTTRTTTATTSTKSTSALDANTLLLLKDFTDTSTDISDESKQAFIDIIDKANLLLNRTQYQVADNVVIADFYVPYLCCSDCSPIAYILPPQDTGGDEPAEFSIESKEYVFDDERNYPFTAQPPVTDKNKGESPFSSPDILNPGNLNILTDDSNILYLNPAMPNLVKTTTSTISYKNIPIDITIIKPDATFTLNETVDAAGVAALQPVAADSKADSYVWKVNGLDGIFDATASPAPVSIAVLQRKTGSSSLTIELTLGYTRNGVISDDVQQQIYQPAVCITFEQPDFKIGMEWGARTGQKEGDVAFTTPEKIIAQIFGLSIGVDGVFGVGLIVQNPQGFATGQCLQLENASMKFNYSDSAIQPSLVTIEFASIDPASTINFGINDDSKNFYSGSIDKLPSKIGGVTIQTGKAQDGSAMWILKGPVKNFVVGGNFMLIDNICAQ